MKIRETSFSQATNEFQDFLSENNLPDEILWLFQEDVFCRKSTYFSANFWLKIPSRIENEQIAEKIYEIGQQRNLGIGLSAFAVFNNTVCCCILLPKDKEDSKFLFFSPDYLKFSFLDNLPTPEIIENSFKWLIFELFIFKYKQGCFLDYLPSKKLAQSNQLVNH